MFAWDMLMWQPPKSDFEQNKDKILYNYVQSFEVVEQTKPEMTVLTFKSTVL